MMRGIAVALVLSACSRQLPDLGSPTVAVEIAALPPPIRIETQPKTTGLTAYAVELSTDVCAGRTNTCSYELRGGQYLEWTPSPTSPPFEFKLDPGFNRLDVRTKNAVGQTSDEQSVEITSKPKQPLAPTHVTVTPTNGQVLVSWQAAESDDVAGYLIYYGTAPGASGDFSHLDAAFAEEGPSPIRVPSLNASRGDELSQALSGIPNGTPVYVAVTAYDEAFGEDVSQLPAFLSDEIAALEPHESPKLFPAEARRQFGTPGELSLRFVNKVAGRSAYAVVAQSDVVVLVSGDASKTYVDTFSLTALTQGDATPLGSLSLNERVSTCTGDKKSAVFFDRYVFIASGRGSVFAVDVADPAHPVSALTGAADTVGCARDVKLSWPFAFVADGSDAADAHDFQDDLPGRITVRQFMMSGNKIATVDADLGASDANYGIYGDTAGAIALGLVDDANGNFFTSSRYGTLRCNRLLSGLCEHSIFSVEPTVLLYEMPLLFALRSSESSASGGLLEIYSTDSDALPIAQVATLPLPAKGKRLAATGRYLFIVNEGTRGLDVVDVRTESSPKLVGLFAGDGDLRDVAVAGPFVLLASEQGLTVADMSQPSILVNSGSGRSSSVPAVRGMRTWVSDASPTTSAPRHKFWNLRDFLRYEPIPPAGGGGAIFCALQNEDNGRLGCGQHTILSGTDDNNAQACIAYANKPSGSWPPVCFSGTTGVRSLALTGPDMLFSYGTSVRSVSLEGLVMTPNNDSVAAGKLALGSQPSVWSTLATSPGWAAVETTAGITLIDRKDRTALAVNASLAALRGPSLAAGEVCGVVFESGDTWLRCFKDGAVVRDIALGASDCTEAATARAGRYLAVALLKRGEAHSCEGVKIIDVDAPARITSFALDLTLPAISIDGPYVYAACPAGMCQLRLRR